MRWTLLLSFALIAVSCYSRIARLEGGDGASTGVEWRTEGSRLDSLFSGGRFVCSCQPCGGGLQTNRVLLFDSVHPAPFRDLAPTFPSRVYRPRITTSPRLFRVHFCDRSAIERVTRHANPWLIVRASIGEFPGRIFELPPSFRNFQFSPEREEFDARSFGTRFRSLVFIRSGKISEIVGKRWEIVNPD